MTDDQARWEGTQAAALGEPLEASEEELALIDWGRREAREGKLLDAHSFLRELRRAR